MFTLSLFASVLGYVIYAACTNIAQYIVRPLYSLKPAALIDFLSHSLILILGSRYI